MNPCPHCLLTPNDNSKRANDRLRVEYAIEKPSNRLLAVTELDSDTRGNVKHIRGKQLPLTWSNEESIRS